MNSKNEWHDIIKVTMGKNAIKNTPVTRFLSRFLKEQKVV